MRLSSLYYLLLYSLPAVAGNADKFLCNTGTKYACPCEECWSTVTPSEPVDWVTVGLTDCPPQFNDSQVRGKLAAWINEECGAALDCHLTERIEPAQIVFGFFSCELETRQLEVIALKNATGPISSENMLQARLVGLVLQSREHLLSFLLHSELNSVLIQKKFKSSPPPHVNDHRIHLPLIIFSSIFVIFLVCIFLIVYFSQIYINWRRIVKGKWDHKEYRKVPHVRYNVEELDSAGHI